MTERVIRWLTAAVVLTVAAFAAIVSYSHIYDLGRSYGQSGTAARILPLSVDGLILAASLVLLRAAVLQLPVPRLAQGMLVSGVLATIGANVAYGIAYGWLGAFISAWPAVAFIGAAEMAIGLVRASGRTMATDPSGAVPAPVPTDAETAAAMAFRATWEAGNPLSQNQLMARFGITKVQARVIRAQFLPELASANGDGSLAVSG